MQQFGGHILTSKTAGQLALSLILIVAALLRFQDLDRTSFWYDEAVSWTQSKGTLTELFSSVAMDNYPPLHNIVLWLTMPFLGDGEAALRLPSAFFGVLAVWLIYLAGNSLAGRNCGLLAAALLAISPFHVWYSTEARMYALLAASGLAFLLALMKMLEKPTLKWSLALALSGTFFLYSHVYALFGFVSAGCICALIALRDPIKSGQRRLSNARIAILVMCASALTFLPWLVIIAKRARSVATDGFWIAYPDLQFLKSMAISITGSLILFLLLTGLALGCVVSAFLAKGPERIPLILRQRMLVCFAFTAGPLLLAYLYSVVVQPILFDRYLISAWLGLLLLASSAVVQLRQCIGPLVLFAAALTLTYPELYFTLRHKIRPEWRLIAETYQTERGSADRLALYKGFAAPALAYYLRGDDAFTPARTIEELTRLSEMDGSGEKWLLVVHSSDQETESAYKAFGITNEHVTAQRFGWGASGLILIKRSTRN